MANTARVKCLFMSPGTDYFSVYRCFNWEFIVKKKIPRLFSHLYVIGFLSLSQIPPRSKHGFK